MDTIANTISLPTPQTGTGTIFDLRAEDFATTSGSSQTLLVTTGQLPFVVADPQLSNPIGNTYTQIVDGTGGPGIAPAVRVQANIGNKLVGLLNVDVLPTRTVKIALHVVSELNGKLSPTSVPSTNKIQKYLNQVYGD